MEFSIPDAIVNEMGNTSLSFEFSFTSLETAAMILRIARATDSRLQKSYRIDEFFKKLEELERKRLNRFSFQSKYVIAVEGLPHSGKSALIQSFQDYFSRVTVIDAYHSELLNEVRSAFHSLPKTISKAFDFVVNYFIAAEVAHSNSPADTLFFIEKFHLNFLVSNMVEQFADVDSMKELGESYTFDWIMDLPIPLAVNPCISTNRTNPLLII
jgi:hypothetical protein